MGWSMHERLEVLTFMFYHHEDVLKQVTLHIYLGLFHDYGTQYYMYLQSDVSLCVCNCFSVLYRLQL
jgi:hypothetical protein